MFIARAQMQNEREYFWPIEKLNTLFQNGIEFDSLLLTE